MVSGIGILGTVTATLASWLTDRLREETAAAEQSVLTEVHALRDEIQSLRQQLAP
jgi:voltage-gated potassium channel